MQCPFCKEQKDKVIDSRATEGGAVIRRRRQCGACRRRYTTYERIEESPRMSVIKKDGTRVPYDRNKLAGGLQRACWKRPISADQVQAIVNDVEDQVFRQFDREVGSGRIGMLVAAALRQVDKVAYLRFASMYHEFQIVDEFIEEARDIIERERQDAPGQQDLFNG